MVQSPVRGCIACRKCAELGRCAFSDDSANTILEKACAADALVLGTSVYWNITYGATPMSAKKRLRCRV